MRPNKADALIDLFLAEGMITAAIYTERMLKSEERTAESAQNVPNDELISKKAAMEAHCELCEDKGLCGDICPDVEVFRLIPSAQQTLGGYNVEHLVLIAKLLEKENLPPERVSDALSDIGRVVAIAEKEFEEMLRKAVEQCMMPPAQPEVIRCKGCKWYNDRERMCNDLMGFGRYWKPDDFCSYGKRRTDG